MHNPFKKVIHAQLVRFSGGPVRFRPRFPWLLAYAPANQLAEVYYLFPLNYLVRWVRLLRYYLMKAIFKLIIKIIGRFDLYVLRLQGSSHA